MNRFTGEKITSETEHIKQSIADILLTPIGSRLQRRDYGSRIPELIDRPMNHALLLQLAASAVMALHKWEPRVTISHHNLQKTASLALLLAEQEIKITSSIMMMYG